MLPRGTYHRKHVAENHPPLPLHDHKRVSNRPAHPPGQKSTWNYSYGNTLRHILTSCSLHQATNRIPYWIGTAKNDGPQKSPKVQTHGVAVSASPCWDRTPPPPPLK